MKIKKILKLIMKAPKRGLLIVFEGMDRVGKSTQCELLVEYFKKVRNEKVEKINFPGS